MSEPKKIDKKALKKAVKTKGEQIKNAEIVRK